MVFKAIRRKYLNEHLKNKKDRPKAVFIFVYSLSNQANKIRLSISFVIYVSFAQRTRRWS